MSEQPGTIRTDDQSTFTFTIKLESDELDGGWVASVVDLPGCMSQGETREEALENVIDAFREILLAELDEQIDSPRLPAADCP